MDTNQVEMEGRLWPSYQAHKVVRAARIVDVAIEKKPDGLTSFIVEPRPGMRELFRPTETAMMARGGVGDFAVIYRDGYKSICPAEAFVDGYVSVSAVEADAGAVAVTQDALEAMVKRVASHNLEGAINLWGFLEDLALLAVVEDMGRLKHPEALTPAEALRNEGIDLARARLVRFIEDKRARRKSVSMAPGTVKGEG